MLTSHTTHLAARPRIRALVALAAAFASLMAALVHAGPASAAGVPMLRLSGPAVGTYNTAFYAQRTTTEHFSSPAVGDLFGNGQSEVVAGYPDGTVHLYSTEGHALHHEFKVLNPGAGPIQASPVLVDLNHDGHLDILVATLDGRIYAWTPSLNYRQIFYAAYGAASKANGDFATPTVADINHDGALDVIETSWSQTLQVWSGRPDSHGVFHELPGFPVRVGDTSWSSPAVADVDGDGWPEIVFGFDCDGAPGQRCYPSWGGYVDVVRHDGRQQPGWPRFVSHQTVWSSPALVDLNNDGHLDVVVGTGNMPASMIYPSHKMDGGHHVFAFEAANGRTLPGWPATVSANTTGSPAVARLTGNSTYQVAEISEDGFLNIINSAGHVVARTCVTDSLSGCPRLTFHGSVTVADIDHDGRLEIVVGGEQWLDVYRLNGSALSLVYRGWTKDASFHGYVTPHPFTAAPTVASIGGAAWVLMSTDTGAGAWCASVLYAFTLDRPLGAAPWPTFKGNSQRTGTAAAPTPAPKAPAPKAPAPVVPKHETYLGTDVVRPVVRVAR